MPEFSEPGTRVDNELVVDLAVLSRRAQLVGVSSLELEVQAQRLEEDTWQLGLDLERVVGQAVPLSGTVCAVGYEVRGKIVLKTSGPLAEPDLKKRLRPDLYTVVRNGAVPESGIPACTVTVRDLQAESGKLFVLPYDKLEIFADERKLHAGQRRFDRHKAA